MHLCFAECRRVLRPGGVMALVLKGFTRDGKYVDLPAQTQALCESLGFTKFDEWQRELWSLSFWRVLQGTDKMETVVAHRQGLFDMDMRYETVLAFRKQAPGHSLIAGLALQALPASVARGSAP